MPDSINMQKDIFTFRLGLYWTSFWSPFVPLHNNVIPPASEEGVVGIPRHVEGLK